MHVDDAASLLAVMAEEEATGFVNAAGPGPLTVNRWIEISADELRLGRIRVLPVPYWAIRFGAWLTRYRIVAREQQLMLGQPHVLSIERSLALGWEPQHTNERIVRDIARYVAGRD